MSLALKLAKRLAQNSPSKYVAAKTYCFYVNTQELEPPLDEPTGDKPQSSLPTITIGLCGASSSDVAASGTFEQVAQEIRSMYPTARRVCVDAYDWLPGGPFDEDVNRFIKWSKGMVEKDSKIDQMHQLKDALMHAGFRVKIET